MEVSQHDIDDLHNQGALILAILQGDSLSDLFYPNTIQTYQLYNLKSPSNYVVLFVRCDSEGRVDLYIEVNYEKVWSQRFTKRVT